MNAAEALLAIRALAALARTLLVEDREATEEELDAVDLRATDSEQRLRGSIRQAEERERQRGRPT